MGQAFEAATTHPFALGAQGRLQAGTLAEIRGYVQFVHIKMISIQIIEILYAGKGVRK